MASVLDENNPKDEHLVGEAAQHIRSAKAALLQLVQYGHFIDTSTPDATEDGRLKYTERVYEMDTLSGNQALDVSLGTKFKIDVTGGINFTAFNNTPGGGNTADLGYGFTLYLIKNTTDDVTHTWPSNVTWVYSPPVVDQTNGSIMVVHFDTYDGGASWLGFFGGVA